MRTPSWPLSLVFIAGCWFPTPYSTEQLARDSQRRPGEALVHYLGQPAGVDLAVCDMRSTPRLARVDAEVFEALMPGFEEGSVPPHLWRGCVEGFWLGDQEQRDLLFASLGGLTQRILGTRYMESSSHTRQLGRQVVAALEARPTDLPVSEDVVKDLVEALRATMASGVGSTAAREITRVVDGLELRHGLWRGEAVDEALIQTIDDEETLRMFRTQLPEPPLQDAAAEQLVRVRIDRSPFAVVTERADEVTAAVLQDGAWSVPLEEFPVVALDRRVMDTSLSELDVEQGGRMVGRSPRGPVNPTLWLNRELEVQLAGMGQPVGLCTWDREALDPTPCIDPAAVYADHPLLRSPQPGEWVFEGEGEAVLQLLAEASEIVVDVTVADARVDVVLPVRFVPPGPLVFQGGPGERGPDLHVEVVVLASGRLRLDLTGGGVQRALVVERDDLSHLRIASRGGDGRPGKRGAPGLAGMMGARGQGAFCPNRDASDGRPGLKGGDGQPGTNGGPGGDGGNVQVVVHCAHGACDQLADSLRGVVASEGGRGGPGGRGGLPGAGGFGGPGGLGANCTDAMTGATKYLSAGRQGPMGPSGQPGRPGADGPAGQSGAVSVEVRAR